MSSRQGSSFDSPLFIPATAEAPNFRRSYHEIVSPALSGMGTPDSSSTGNSIPTSFVYPQGPTSQFVLGDTNLPDMGAMMFPSADPFAYPNQAMIEFDQHLQQNQQTDQKINPGMFEPGNRNSGQALPNLFMGNGTPPPGASLYDNLEGQLFGPLPPYLMQSQGAMGMNGGEMDMSGMPGMMGTGIPGGNNVYGASSGAGGVLGAGMNFDDIFASNNEDWNSMIADQGFKG